MPRQSRLTDSYSPTSHSPSDSSNEDYEPWDEDYIDLPLPAPDLEKERNADPMYPSPHRFELMLHDYLRRLSPKKREKALLSQKMYDAVLCVLQDPKDTSTKTAQFRFWAKKMFDLTSFGGETIVCHEKKPVAVKEQIYEVLVHCHGQAGHGGRDKTSYQVRRYYSWIPKEVIARFVKECPFCQSRRTQANSALGAMSESQAFLISLQSKEPIPNDKRPVSLAQARANAAALGHKPFRRNSHQRMIPPIRTRRGSAMSSMPDGSEIMLSSTSSQGYIHYADGPLPEVVVMNGHSYVPPETYNTGRLQRPAPYPRRANSFQESAIQVPEMYRRASAGDINQYPRIQHATQTQFLTVPTIPGVSVSSIRNDRPATGDSLEDVRQFARQLTDGGVANERGPFDVNYSVSSATEPQYAEQQFQQQYTGAVQGWDPVSNAPQTFDGNNVFALGEAAGMTQDQVESMHESNPAMLGDLHQQHGGTQEVHSGDYVPVVYEQYVDQRQFSEAPQSYQEAQISSQQFAARQFSQEPQQQRFTNEVQQFAETQYTDTQYSEPQQYSSESRQFSPVTTYPEIQVESYDEQADVLPYQETRIHTFENETKVQPYEESQVQSFQEDLVTYSGPAHSEFGLDLGEHMQTHFAMDFTNLNLSRQGTQEVQVKLEPVDNALGLTTGEPATTSSQGEFGMEYTNENWSGFEVAPEGQVSTLIEA